jgi:hypothetical protein
VDGEIRTHLHEWENPALLTQVSHGFARSGFFGVSALGGAPGAGGKLEEIKPMRVLDPLIWLLHYHGLVKKGK